MMKILGVYEHERDGYQYPSCWRVINNSCMPHFHSSVEFVYVTQGELRASLNGVSSVVKANQLLMVSSYMAHRYETVSSSEAIVLIVPLDFIPSYQKLLMQNDFKQSVYEDSSLESSELLHCMKILSRGQGNEHQTQHPDRQGLYLCDPGHADRSRRFDRQNKRIHPQYRQRYSDLSASPKNRD